MPLRWCRGLTTIVQRRHGPACASSTTPAPTEAIFRKQRQTKKIKKADSTLRTSQAVPHPSTIRALSCLTSEVKRDPVYSTRYGRQRKICDFFSFCVNIQKSLPNPPLGRVLRHFLKCFLKPWNYQIHTTTYRNKFSGKNKYTPIRGYAAPTHKNLDDTAGLLRGLFFPAIVPALLHLVSRASKPGPAAPCLFLLKRSIGLCA